MNSGTEDEWSGDEGQRIISDATVPSALETGLEEPVKLYAVDDVREKEKVPKAKPFLLRRAKEIRNSTVDIAYYQTPPAI